MSAPMNNQNGAKSDEERASSFIHAAVTPTDKGLFKAAAEDWARDNKVTDKRGVFTMWLIHALHSTVPQSIKDKFSKRQ